MAPLDWPSYDSYQDSGFEWLDAIPAGWIVKRLKHVTRQVSDKVSSADISLPYIGMENVESWSGRLVEGGSEVEGLAAKFSAGDVIFGKLRPYLAKAVKLEFPGMCSTEFIVFRTTPGLEPDFLAYLLRSAQFVSFVDSSTYGSKMPRANPSFIANCPVGLPPPQEQRVIAAFLDEKCAKVDEAVRIKEEQIALLRERRQILIQEAVTRGLNPNVPMKDTGVQWIGRVPEHWQVWKLAHAFPKLGSGTTPDTGQASFYDGGIAWLQTGDLNDGAATTTAKTVSKLAVRHYPTLKVYPPNSVVMAMYGATIGKLGILQIAAATNQACCVLPKSQIVTPEFAFFCLLAMRPYILSEAYGGGQPNISQNTVKNFRLPVPSVGEQREITTFLDCESERIDKALRIKLAQITAIKEYKTTLINAAVTGKIKVA